MAKITVHFDSGFDTTFESPMTGWLSEVPNGNSKNVEGIRQGGTKLKISFLDVKSGHWFPSIIISECSKRNVTSVTVDHNA